MGLSIERLTDRCLKTLERPIMSEAVGIAQWYTGTESHPHLPEPWIRAQTNIISCPSLEYYRIDWNDA